MVSMPTGIYGRQPTTHEYILTNHISSFILFYCHPLFFWLIPFPYLLIDLNDKEPHLQ